MVENKGDALENDSGNVKDQENNNEQNEDFNNPLSLYANDNSNNEQEKNLKISQKAMSFTAMMMEIKKIKWLKKMTIHPTALKMNKALRTYKK